MGLFRKETRSSITPTQPVIFVPQNGFTLVSSGEQVVNSTPALQSAVSTISNDMNTVRFTGGQSKVLNKIDFVTTFRQMLIEGNAFMIIKRDSRGVISSLQPVNSVDVTINLNQGALSYTINNTTTDEPYNSGIYDEKDVLNFAINRGTYGIERFVGHSPIESLKNTLSQSQLANKQIESVLKESISPKLLLSLMADATDTTKKAIKSAFMNANDNDSVIISDSQVKVSKLFSNDSSNDNLINLSKTLSDSVNVIATAFDIPSSKLGANAQDDAQSSVSMIEQQYIDSLIHNYLSIILNELHTKISDSVELDLTKLVDFDNSKLIQQTISLVGAGILPTDEAYTLLVKKGVLNE